MTAPTLHPPTTRPLCDACGDTIDYAAFLCDAPVCTSCEIRRLRARRESDEWSVFVSALRQAAVGGVVRWNDVRPIIRGRIFHKHIGSLVKKAKAQGLLVEIKRESSADAVGRNTHHDSGVYRLRGAA
ncbi:MAG TPA: hypothetical protein VGE38_07480 [Nocardioides sp.]|uniref:hypothetical protein n=1 Tax=Nocardioides sp. TaxID=35761 RepID=UPI002EDA393E